MRSRGTRGGIEKEGATEVEMKQDVKTPERRVILIGGGGELRLEPFTNWFGRATKVTRRKNADGQTLSSKDPGCESPGKDAIFRELLGQVARSWIARVWTW